MLITNFEIDLLIAGMLKIAFALIIFAIQT